METRRFARFALVALVGLLMGRPPSFTLADDGPSSEKKEATTSARPSEGAKANSDDQITALKQQIGLQQKQIEQLQKALEEQRRLLKQLAEPASTAPPTSPPIISAAGPNLASQPHASNLGEVAAQNVIVPETQRRMEDAATPLAPAPAAGIGDPNAAGAAAVPPLQLKLGTATIIPIGFMDFTGMWRSHDVGSGIGTNFASIPYGSGTYSGNLSESRMSMQNSRIGFRVDALVKGAHVIGYMEADFLGNNPGNVAVSSNSNTLRSRLYWADVRKGRWEVLGGQSWSLLTPGRSGISPLTADVFYTLNMDTNYQVGLVWGRIPELRVVYHLASDKAALAVALDSPEQYAGGSSGGPLVTFPAALSSAYSGELNVGTNTLGVPNVAPDVIAKLAVDPCRKVHLEVGGVERNFKLWDPLNNRTYTAAGGGGSLNLNFELFKGFRVLTNNFLSDGGGRYIFGQAPDLIAKVDGAPSLVHADSTVSGVEYTLKNTVIYSYYGGVYVGRDFTIDTNGKPVGYGYTGSSSAQNKSIQEGTFGAIQTFWKNPRYGALSLITQYAYLDRNPWYVAAGQPKEAHLNMIFLDLRYTLPGSAPATSAKATAQ
jgi:hypothetical protein